MTANNWFAKKQQNAAKQTAAIAQKSVSTTKPDWSSLLVKRPKFQSTRKNWRDFLVKRSSIVMSAPSEVVFAAEPLFEHPALSSYRENVSCIPSCRDAVSKIVRTCLRILKNGKIFRFSIIFNIFLYLVGKASKCEVPDSNSIVPVSQVPQILTDANESPILISSHEHVFSNDMVAHSSHNFYGYEVEIFTHQESEGVLPIVEEAKVTVAASSNVATAPLSTIVPPSSRSRLDCDTAPCEFFPQDSLADTGFESCVSLNTSPQREGFVEDGAEDQVPQPEINFDKLNLNDNNSPTESSFPQALTDQVTIGKKCGEGGFGEVYECTVKGSGMSAVVKCMYRLHAQTHICLEDLIMKEVAILKHLTASNTPLVSKYYGCAEDEISGFIIIERSGTPWCPSNKLIHPKFDSFPASDPDQCVGTSDLLSFLHTVRPTFNMEKFLFTQLSLAFWSIHNAGVVHGDIKPENVLIDSNLRVKIIDFGLSQFITQSPHFADGQLREDLCPASIMGTYGFRAPELLKNEPFDGKAADVFSLGTLFYWILYMHFPFPLAYYDTIETNCLWGESLPNCPPVEFGGDGHCPLWAKEMITGMLLEDPKERWKMPQVCRILKRVVSDELLKGALLENYVFDLEAEMSMPDRHL